MKKICHCFKEKDCYSQVIRICEIEALLLHIHIVDCGLSNSLSFAFSLLFAIINPCNILATVHQKANGNHVIEIKQGIL